MTYEQALQFWFGRINYEQKAPLPDDLKLDHVRALLARLGDPQERLRILHVAGSKGKGSTSAMLASILAHEGFRTGLFTSPHLAQVEERIQVDQEPIRKEEVATLLAEIRAASLKPPALEPDLTFFEVGTALGFLHFLRRRVELAVVEVGLGGRFDSTNVCNPLVSILTSISFDHTQQLGNTLAAIAREKAGILKPARPAVSGVRGAEARTVISASAQERGVKLRQIDADYSFAHEPALVTDGAERLPRVHVQTWRRSWRDLELGLIGAHQASNAALAVATVEVLREQGLPISERAVRTGLRAVVWPARLEILGRQPLVLLDCAHNVASAQALAESLTASFASAAGARWLIFAGSRDKDLAGMLQVLAPRFDRHLLTRYRNGTRFVPPEQLLDLLPNEFKPAAGAFPTAEEAWRFAKKNARPNDLICVTGSVFLAGELRPIILSE
jgi:dihydrofolate synthase/folylpolyglutamate synthase